MAGRDVCRKRPPMDCIKHSGQAGQTWYTLGGVAKMDEWYRQLKQCSLGGDGCQGWEIGKCNGSPHCIRVWYRKMVVLAPCRRLQKKQRPRPSFVGWFMALDPDSYSIRQDRESYGVYWCETPNCVNYYKFHGQNLRRASLVGPDLFAERCGGKARLAGWTKLLVSTFYRSK